MTQKQGRRWSKNKIVLYMALAIVVILVIYAMYEGQLVRKIGFLGYSLEFYKNEPHSNGSGHVETIKKDGSVQEDETSKIDAPKENVPQTIKLPNSTPKKSGRVVDQRIGINQGTVYNAGRDINTNTEKVK